MRPNSLTILFAGLLFMAGDSWLAQDARSEEQLLQKKLEKFFKAETKMAKSMLSDFNTEQVDRILNDYKKGRSLKENRIFWLMEEYFQRKADKIASRRLIFLFIAVIALIFLLITMVWANLREQKKLLSKL